MVSDIPAGDGKSDILVLGCIMKYSANKNILRREIRPSFKICIASYCTLFFSFYVAACQARSKAYRYGRSLLITKQISGWAFGHPIISPQVGGLTNGPNKHMIMCLSLLPYPNEMGKGESMGLF
jgi:hypothetical protein